MTRFVKCTVALAALGVATLAAQEIRGGRRDRDGPAFSGNTPYDGRFTFARIKFEPLGGEGGWRRDLKWDHDFPHAERNLMKILKELSTLDPFMDGGNVFTLDDPELHRFPIAYVSEPGFWTLSDAEATGMRTYLQKGGFAIFDDFFGEHWYNFETQMLKVLPQARIVRLDSSHPIFDSFFHITSLDYRHPYFGHPSEFYGVFEDNDPSKRLMVIVNYNNDIGDYWEYSDMGYFPIELSNEAYKLGVNYLMYAMTH
jgi:Domain of unknown function (DUF4159)